MHLFACSVPPTTFQLPASSGGIQNAYGKGRQGKTLLRFAEGRCQLRGAPSLHLTEEGKGKERDSKSIYLPERRPRRKQPSDMPCAPRLQPREQKRRETKDWAGGRERNPQQRPQSAEIDRLLEAAPGKQRENGAGRDTGRFFARAALSRHPTGSCALLAEKPKRGGAYSLRVNVLLFSFKFLQG